jgi:hypothetical protein
VPSVNLEQYVQEDYDPALMREMVRVVEDVLNRLSDGRLYQRKTATSAPSASGDNDAYSVGDQVINSNPTELGAALSKYIIVGWICIADGTPGTWREMRVLTGN